MKHVLLLLIVLQCAACALLSPHPAVPMRQYAIDPPIAMAQTERTELTLGIRPLSAARPYEREMAYLDEQQLLEYRTGHTWAERPGTIVTRAITDAISATGRFSDVGNAANMTRPDLHLTGEVRKFHENRTVSPPVAEIEVRLELRQAIEKQNFWDGTLVARVPLEGDTPADLAAAMQAAVAEIATQAATAIAGSV